LDGGKRRSSKSCTFEGNDEDAHTKNQLQNRLGELVCSGALDLKTAQEAQAGNSVRAYQTYVGPPPDFVNGR